MLLPPGGAGDEPVPLGRGAVSVVAPSNFVARKSDNLGKLWWEQLGVIRQASGKNVDILHTPYLVAPLFAGRPRRRKTGGHRKNSRYLQVVTAHDMIPWVLPGYSGSRFFKLYLALAAAGVKRADAIMADSEASRKDAIRILGVSPSKVYTVYLGAESPPQNTADATGELRARLDLPQNYAFYLGGFDRRKNVPLLLDAWHDALPYLHSQGDEKPLLVIGGAVPDAGGVFPDIMGKARELGFSGENSPIRFLGRISEQDKPLLMAGARLFLYPSQYEGFGLDPLEAMSVGCPVVSSSGGSLKEVVGEGGLLVEPGNSSLFSQAIISAWNNEGLREKLSHLGRARASTFTWERTAEQTLEVYRKTLGGRR